MVKNMKSLLLILPLLFISVLHADAQLTGFWISTDHIDDTPRSIVRVYEANGKYFGKIEKLLPTATITHCTGCKGEMQNKSLVGMVFMKDLIKKENGAVDGKILDPATGKYYSCDIELVSPYKLKVTGYVGFPWLGKEMIWTRQN
jgi:uncharacterized protein (DUF2147 family)